MRMRRFADLFKGSLSETEFRFQKFLFGSFSFQRKGTPLTLPFRLFRKLDMGVVFLLDDELGIVHFGPGGNPAGPLFVECFVSGR
mgnify:CR=1 FL=1